MENCTIYSHQLDFEKVIQIVKSKLPKAKIEVKDSGKQKSLIATVKGGFFGKTKTLKINYRERENPSYKIEKIDCGLTQNLAGMANYIQSLPAKNKTIQSKFLYKVMAANCEMPFIADPEINTDFATILKAIVQELNGFIFTAPNKLFTQASGQYFVNKNFQLIIDQAGNCQIQDLEVKVDAKYHDEPTNNYSKEQITRKAKSEAFLEKNGIKVNKNLPCLPASTNTHLRTIQAIVDRAYALLIVAVKGEGIEQAHLIRTVQDKNINSFSPKETMIYQADSLNEQDTAYATWRYEGLYTLLWALGKMPDLKYPSDICDVQAIVGQIFKPTRTEFENSVQLKDVSEILDKLDEIYRMNWACVDARIKGQTVAGNINPSVIHERHYTLNWLTSYKNQDWDEVQTNT